jgi:hypothetical protein
LAFSIAFFRIVQLLVVLEADFEPPATNNQSLEEDKDLMAKENQTSETAETK